MDDDLMPPIFRIVFVLILSLITLPSISQGVDDLLQEVIANRDSLIDITNDELTLPSFYQVEATFGRNEQYVALRQRSISVLNSEVTRLVGLLNSERQSIVSFLITSDGTEYEEEKEDDIVFSFDQHQLTNEQIDVSYVILGSFAFIYLDKQLIETVGVNQSFQTIEFEEIDTPMVYLIKEEFDYQKYIDSACQDALKDRQEWSYSGTCVQCLNHYIDQKDWASALSFTNAIIENYNSLKPSSLFFEETNGLQPLGYYYDKKVALLENEGKMVDAINLLAEIITNNDSLSVNPKAFNYRWRALLLERINKIDFALTNFDRAVQADSTGENVSARLLFKHRQKQDYSDDLDPLIALIKEEAYDYDKFLKVGRLYEQLGMVEKAEKEYTMGIEELEEVEINFYLRSQRAQLRDSLGDIAGAGEDYIAIAWSTNRFLGEELLKAYSDNHADSEYGPLVTGVAHIPRQADWNTPDYDRLNSAEAELQRSLQIKPNYEAYYYLALVESQRDNYEVAIDYAEKAKSINFSMEVVKLLSDLHQENRSGTEALYFAAIYYWKRVIIGLLIGALLFIAWSMIRKRLTDMPTDFIRSEQEITSSHKVRGSWLTMGIFRIVISIFLFGIGNALVEMQDEEGLLGFVLMIGSYGLMAIGSFFFLSQLMLLIYSYRVFVYANQLVISYPFFGASKLINIDSIQSIYGENEYHQTKTRFTKSTTNSRELTINYDETKSFQLSSMKLSNFEELREKLADSVDDFVDESTEERTRSTIKGSDILDEL